MSATLHTSRDPTRRAVTHGVPPVSHVTDTAGEAVPGRVAHIAARAPGHGRGGGRTRAWRDGLAQRGRDVGALGARGRVWRERRDVTRRERRVAGAGWRSGVRLRPRDLCSVSRDQNRTA